MYTLIGLLALSGILLVYATSCFAFVKEGTAKMVVRFGGYRKTLFVKKGFKLSPAGDVVPLSAGEGPEYPDFMGGLRWVSWLKPLGIDKIYSCVMRYVKVLPDGSFEDHKDENTDFILTGTQYQYGLEFKSMEDKAKLPLNGKMTLTAKIVNPYRALFLVKNWFDAMISRILPRVREHISEHTYNEIITDPSRLDEDVFNALNQAGEVSATQPSVISILKDQYGIELLALETVNVDPPEGYRETTLAKWTAQQIADKDVEATAGRILKSVAMSANLAVDELKEILKGDGIKLRGISNSEGGFKEDFDRAWDQVKRDRAGAGLKDVRVGNADGTGLDSLTATVAAIISLARGGEGSPGGGKDGKKPKRTYKELEEEHKGLTGK